MVGGIPQMNTRLQCCNRALRVFAQVVHNAARSYDLRCKINVGFNFLPAMCHPALAVRKHSLHQWFSIGGPRTPKGSEMGFLGVRALLPFVTISYEVSAIVVNLIRHYNWLECNVHHVVSVQ